MANDYSLYRNGTSSGAALVAQNHIYNQQWMTSQQTWELQGIQYLGCLNTYSASSADVVEKSNDPKILLLLEEI